MHSLSVLVGNPTQSTAHADNGDGDTESLLQLDQLVHLLESPVFTRLRLELLPNSYLIGRDSIYNLNI